MSDEITITVSGPVGCGKSAIAGEIEIAMRALGVPVRFADPAAMQAEKNMPHADWTSDLEMYQPRVVIGENIVRPTISAAKIEARVGGAYKMPDGRTFWIDGPVAREIARRALDETGRHG